MSKGSNLRPYNHTRFGEAYDRIFRKAKEIQQEGFNRETTGPDRGAKNPRSPDQQLKTDNHPPQARAS